MSLPEFPAISPALTREEAINQIISSIAMEELALSHIINAEGEKLQYVLGTIPGVTGPQPTIEQVLEVNESVRSVLESAAETQSILRLKLQTALSASVMRGPAGPPGESGIVEAVGFQAGSVGGANIIPAGSLLMFNQVSDENNPDISYDDTTGLFTINKTGKHSFYLISWWFYADGYAGVPPFYVAINVNGALFKSMSAPYVQTQISGSALIPVTNSSASVTLTNASPYAFALPVSGTQAEITILGFKSQN